jgi:EF hand domain-containing protein
MSHKALTIALLLIGAGAGTAVSVRGQGAVNVRFQGMDQNGDGVITRTEWRGSAKSFQVHDWNGDGKLSGEEVRVGASRNDRKSDPNFDSADSEYVFDDWTDRGFRALDHNKDGRVTRDEWHFSRVEFRYADHNNDGAVSRAEFLNQDGEDDDREDRFPYLDGNHDGRVSRQEWHGAASRFTALDTNRDGVLTQVELVGSEPPPDLFSSVDVNRDRVLTRDEWHWSQASFNERDVNRDGRLSVPEFNGTAASRTQSGAYRAGYERGTTEGRAAGREERLANRAWDLEGQSELDNADSGYQPGMGAREEYQNGYRGGFRRAYREGWDSAK